MLADYSLEVIDKKGGIYLGKNETNQKGFESYFKSYNDLRFYEKDIPVQFGRAIQTTEHNKYQFFTTLYVSSSLFDLSVAFTM